MFRSFHTAEQTLEGIESPHMMKKGQIKRLTGSAASRWATVIKSQPMNERQLAHIDLFLERVEYWKALKRDKWTARMLAARDADQAHPLRSEEEGTEVFDHLRRLEESTEQPL